MRILLKILCAPVVAVLAVAGWFFTFLLSVSAAVLGIAAVVIGLLGLFILILDSAVNGIIVLGVAFLISPYGLPMLAAWLIAQLHGLRYAIQDAVYS